MASVDAGQYSLSSDEKFEFECSPCKDDGLVREAKYVCPECSEYFCSSCESSLHGRLTVTKSHKLLPTSDSTKSVPQKTAKLPIMTCICNRDRAVEFVCDKHKCLFCSECKILNHRKCKIVTIAEKSKSVTQRTINASLEDTKSLGEKAKHIQDAQNESLETFEAKKLELKKEICEVRNQLTGFVESLAQKALDEVAAVPFVQSQELKSNLSVCNSIIDKLKIDLKTLQDAQATGEPKQMYVADFLVTNSLKNYYQLLEEVESETKSTSLSFKLNSVLYDIQSKIKKLGDIVVEDQFIGKEIGQQGFPLSLSALTAVKGEVFDITPATTRRMTGSTFLTNGDLVVCDFSSQNIIILDNGDFKEKDRLSVPGNPWGVDILNENEIIVSLYNAQKLQTMEVEPTLKLKSGIDVGKRCFDVKTANKTIFVFCSEMPEIRMYDEGGTLKKSISHSFNYPLNMAISHNKDRFYVSDLSNKNVVCMSLDGQVLSTFNNPEFTNPRGILLDMGDYFLLCNDDCSGKTETCIYKVPTNGTKCTKFLSNTDGIKNPYCLSYRNIDRMLVVTCQSKLLAFRLE